ncbi:MAG TPA: oligopeptide/dipeptide ABC transporter ATP-binding protein [Acidimicrobiales bacterium]|nr:oligopeptide/dipeptide ABC transporter ATP-binding protein [Acidimicrobiales bacterium]
MATTDPLLRVEHLTVEFSAKGGGTVHAVTDVSFDLHEGETLGLVGESGCGKSTTARSIMQLPPPTSGSVVFEGTELTGLSGSALRQVRPRMQMIFQDPVSSLNPRRGVADIIAEPLATWHVGNKKERQAKVAELMDAVGLDYDRVARRRRGAFSGGQCQRVSIARALALEPKLLICDEAVSALDVSVQAQILNLLEAMKARYGLTLIFVAHDLAVVKRVSDRVAVMYLGKLCEVAPAEDLYRAPAHHYTAALLKAIPQPDPARRAEFEDVLTGEPPSASDPPTGCRFRTRCPRAEERCAVEVPELERVAPGHFVACHFPLARSTESTVSIGPPRRGDGVPAAGNGAP